MNTITKVIAYIPALRAYLKGVIEFNSGHFESAIKNLDKCIKHPSFNNELAYSHYGQALCALGQLNEGHSYLLRAFDCYEINSWKLKDQHEFQLAQGTLSALRHISENTDIEVSQAILDKRIKGSPTK